MAPSSSAGGRARRSDTLDLIRFDELELAGLIEFLRDCPGRISAAVVPDQAVGEALVERLRVVLAGAFTIELADSAWSPGEIGQRAVELGHFEDHVLIVPLHGRRRFADEEEAVSFWRRLNYQRERLASGKVRTCLLVDDQGDRRLALAADDLAEWVSFHRFPAAVPLHPVETSPQEIAGIKILRAQLHRARAAGMPDAQVVRDYAAPLFQALAGAHRMAEARRIWEEDLVAGDPDVLDLLVPEQRDGILEAGRRLSLQDAVLKEWFAQVAKEHRRLADHFERPAELHDLETAWVRLELARAGGERRKTLEDFLFLDPEEHRWATGRWLVEGDPGSGKTTLLRHLAGRLAVAGDQTRVPLFIALPKIVDPLRMPLDYVAREYGAFCGAEVPAVLDRTRRESLPVMLDRAGRAGWLVVLLDGFDEVPPERRDRVRHLLAELAKEWPKSPVVVTSRPLGLGEQPPGFLKLLLHPLDDTQRQRFLEKWFRHRQSPDFAAEARRAGVHFDSERALRELSHNPLHLTLLTVLWEQGTMAPKRLSELYDAIFQLLLEGRYKDPPRAIPSTECVRQALRYLAYALTDEDQPYEEPERLVQRLWEDELDAVRGRLTKVALWGEDLRIFLDAVYERTYILGPHDGPRTAWRFWHRTFREALTAERLEEIHREQGEAALLSRVETIEGDLGRWAEPFALLAGRLGHADRLVTRLAETNRPLGLRALATAQGLTEETLQSILGLAEGLEQRRRVFQSIPEQIDDSEACLALLDRLRRQTRNGDDLYFLYEVTGDAAKRWPDYARRFCELMDRFFDHIPPPENPELFGSIDTPRDGPVKLWCEIPAGEGWIGSPESEEWPRQRIRIARPFQLAAVPVTNAQYAAFDPETADAQCPHHPVENVTWYEAVSFCRWLAAQLSVCAGARLPTEEEWEYACRAGTETRYWSGDSEEALKDVGWYIKNSFGLHPAGEKRANPWGLYDVHGNVWEWTKSTYGGSYVLRGGACGYHAANALSAYRASWSADTRRWGRGFRVCAPCP